MQLPTRDEINVHDSLDERSACDSFLGKTLEQAEAMFRDHSILYQEDLMWMGPTAFCFYLPAFLNYLRSDSADDADLSCLVMILRYRLECDKRELIPVVSQVVSICQHILEHFDRYAVNLEIYEDLRTRTENLLQEFQMLIQR